MKKIENLFIDEIVEKTNRIKLIRNNCREDMKAFKSLEQISSHDGNLFRVMKSYLNSCTIKNFRSEAAANIYYEASDQVY